MTETQVWEHHELGKELNNWGRWGDDDQLGTLNFVTAAKRLQAAQSVKNGKIFDLGVAFDKNGPWLAGGFRPNPQHIMTLLPSDTAFTKDGQISADDMIIMGLQSSTQWDGLAHVGYGGQFYNGVPSSAVNNFQGCSKNGIEHVIPSLNSRGVLLDVARAKGVDRLEGSYQITGEDLEAAEERQGLRVESGDIVLIRTGWHQYFLEGDREKYMSPPPGPGIKACRWFYDREVAAMTIDQWAGECFPASVEGASIPFHQVVIRDMGLTIGEIFDFEELAKDCEADKVYVGFFLGGGLRVTNAAGCPTTPMFVK